MSTYIKKKRKIRILFIPQILNKILEDLTNTGAKPVLVGGCIRDFYLKIPCKDYDIEVYNINSLNELEALLKKYGRVVLAGKSFGVLKLSCESYEFDFALPRREKKVGVGHQGFEVQTNGNLTFKEASVRRDFTINAMGYDFQRKQFLDPYYGKKDLDNKILRHIKDDTFVEDPLRVYRAVQFCARFDLLLDRKTVELCKQIVDGGQLEELAKERVFEEFKKLLLKASKPSLGFELLRELGILKYFPQLQALIGCKQEAQYHPEGDVWVHTLMCLDEMVELRTKDEYKDLYLMLAVLCHDFGKPSTSVLQQGKITSYNHEKMGIKPTIEFLELLTNEKKLIEKVTPFVQHHLAPFQLFFHNSSLKAVKRLATKVNIEELCLVALADCKGRTIPNKDKCDKAVQWLLTNAQALNVHNEQLQPIVLGRDLLHLGLSPSPLFKEILNFAYELQLEDENFTKENLIEAVQKEFMDK